MINCANGESIVIELGGAYMRYDGAKVDTNRADEREYSI